MTVNTRREAWNTANEIFPTDYIKNDAQSTAAGYDVYTSTAAGVNAWISDLGNRLEINLENGKTINIWIESTESTEATETAKATEKTITLESESERTIAKSGETIHKTSEAELVLSADTKLSEIARFERAARLLIKHARSDRKNGAAVSVRLSVGYYAHGKSGIIQCDFQSWLGDGDHITEDGVHLNPDPQYNEDLTRDLWITGSRGEMLDELAI